MTIAYLRFDLPEDQNEYNMVNNAGKLFSALWDIQQELRKYYKHGHEFKDADDAVEKIRDKFYEILGDYHLNLDEM